VKKQNPCENRIAVQRFVVGIAAVPFDKIVTISINSAKGVGLKHISTPALVALHATDFGYRPTEENALAGGREHVRNERWIRQRYWSASSPKTVFTCASDSQALPGPVNRTV
jgi:hypothetical protein